jgi:uncharacterized Zn-finger protein
MGIIRGARRSTTGRLARPAMSNPEAPETVIVEETTVGCDGGGPLGHPLVYLNLGDKGEVDCPYCDRRFVLQRAHARP